MRAEGGRINARLGTFDTAMVVVSLVGALVFAEIGSVQPRTQVSTAGLLLFGVTMLVPAFLLGSFEKLLNYVIFTDMLTLVVVSSTLFVLRKRGEEKKGREGREGKDGVFRIPGFPVLPALYVLALAAVAVHVAITEPRLALAGTAILLTGWPLFLVGRRLSRAPAIVASGRP